MANIIGAPSGPPNIPPVQPFPTPGTDLGAAAAMPSLPGAPYVNAPGMAGQTSNANDLDSRYVMSSDNNILTATDSQTGDAIAYARQTKSFLVHSGDTGVTIYGYGNGAYGMQNGAQDISLAVSASGDSTLSEHGKTMALGKITNPHVLAALAQLFGGKAANDLAVAIATKDLERTSVGAAFPIPVVAKLVRVQGRDNRALIATSLPPAQARTLALQQAAIAQQYGTAAPAAITSANAGLDPSALAASTNPYANAANSADDSDPSNPFQSSPNPYSGDVNPNPFGDPTNMNPFASSANPYAGGSDTNPYASAPNPYADGSSNPYASSDTNPYAADSTNPYAGSDTNPYADASSNPYGDSSNPYASTPNPYASSS